jgi:hypothetical protein
MNVQKLIIDHLSSFTKTHEDTIPVHKIVDSTFMPKRKFLKGICNMVFNGKLTLGFNRRDREDLFLSSVNPQKKVLEDETRSFDLICQVLELYDSFNMENTLNDFLKFVPAKYRNVEILTLLMDLNATLIDLKLVCRWVTSYFSGRNPISILDLGFSAHEMIIIHEQFADDAIIPAQQELLDLKAERSGIYMHGTMRPRLLHLIRNRKVSPLPFKRNRSKGLYFDLRSAEIQTKKLFYNERESEFFSEVRSMVESATIPFDAGVTILLHGPSGTGKTEFAHQMARALQADIMQVNLAEVQSKWVGETEKNLRSLFDAYDRKQRDSENPIILLMNEADGIMNQRVSVSHGSDAYHNQSQSQLLEILDEFKGVLIATTNLKRNMDPAFQRRFMYKQEISLPDLDTRSELLRSFEISAFLTKQDFETIIQSAWSPGAMQILNHRILQLAKTKSLTSSKVMSILMGEGVIQTPKTLGFQMTHRQAS